MPSRSSALSSATTTRRRASGTVPSGGVASSSAMSDGVERMIADRLDLERVEHAVARILAETEAPVEVYERVLSTIGGSLGWELGAVWEVDLEDGRLRCAKTWHTGEGAREFQALSERMVLGPGEGLPGT